MKIKPFEKFEKSDSAYIDLMDYIKDSTENAITYSEYIAESLNNDFGTSGNYGSSGKAGSSGYGVAGKTGSTSEKPRIYPKEIFNTEPIKEIEPKYIPKKINDNFGSWTKNNKKSLPLYEKWMIGIGICSLIVGIITVIVMLISK